MQVDLKTYINKKNKVFVIVIHLIFKIIFYLKIY
jgi:hypothetical protein